MIGARVRITALDTLAGESSKIGVVEAEGLGVARDVFAVRVAGEGEGVYYRREHEIVVIEHSNKAELGKLALANGAEIVLVDTGEPAIKGLD